MLWKCCTQYASIFGKSSSGYRTQKYQFSFQSQRKLKVKVKSLSFVGLFAYPWTVAYQTPLSMGFSRQEHWIGLPFPSPGDLSDPGTEPGLPNCRKMLYLLSHQGISKKDNAKECSNCCTIPLISNASKQWSKFSKRGFNNTWTGNSRC